MSKIKHGNTCSPVLLYQKQELDGSNLKMGNMKYFCTNAKWATTHEVAMAENLLKFKEKVKTRLHLWT